MCRYMSASFLCLPLFSSVSREFAPCISVSVYWQCKRSQTTHSPLKPHELVFSFGILHKYCILLVCYYCFKALEAYILCFVVRIIIQQLLV